jgi:hypothetical protein
MRLSTLSLIAVLLVTSAAHAATCSQQEIARTATWALDAQRSLMALPVSEDTATDVSVVGRNVVAAMKDRLNGYAVATMRCAPGEVNAADLKKALTDFAGVKLPESGAVKQPPPYMPRYGDGPVFDVRLLPSDAVGIVARFGIACGDDAMLMIFERRGGAWIETLRTQSAPYKTVAGAWESFDYGVSPRDKAGRWFVTTKNMAPWCSSTWSEIRYAVLRPGADAGHPRTLLSKTDSIWWGTDRTGDLKVDATGFDLRWRAESMDDGVHNREWIAHYAVDGDRVYRTPPIVESPRDFADEWVRLDWPEAKAWTANVAYGLKPLHDRLHKMRNFDYIAIRRCAADQTQIEVQPTDPDAVMGHVFFEVSCSKDFQMDTVGFAASPHCKGPNLFDINKPQ